MASTAPGSVPGTKPLVGGAVGVCVALGLACAAVATREWIHVESHVHDGASLDVGLWTVCYVPVATGEKRCVAGSRAPVWLTSSRVFSCIMCVDLGLAALALLGLGGFRVAKRACGCDVERRVVRRTAWTCLLAAVSGCTAMSLMAAQGGARVGLALEAAGWSVAAVTFAALYAATARRTPSEVLRSWLPR